MKRYDSLEEELLQESSTLGHFDNDSGIAFPRNELEYGSRYPPSADYDQDDIEMSSPSPAERRILHHSARAFDPPQISRLPNNALARGLRALRNTGTFPAIRSERTWLKIWA
ncbi:hypothetical protein HWV62_26262 [Athelia sp. TMB]|nr:hypothetical protein HWV62_26262 [Athelia sp. TMB]